jgi:predicted nucleotidyltransferase
MDTAIKYELSPDLEVRVVTAPYFLATKIEAFLGRGKGDYLWSHDLEDLIFVIDGRSAIVDEVQADTPWLREYLSTRIKHLLATSAFIDALPGYLLPDAASQVRIGTVIRRLEAIASV